jgi:hypothetical protein
MIDNTKNLNFDPGGSNNINFSPVLPLLNNNNNNNNNNLQYPSPSLNCHVHNHPSPLNNRFAAVQSSPSLQTSIDTISFASINARGLNTPSKFDSLINDFINYNISVIGIQETKITESKGSMMFRTYQQSTLSPYKAYWSYNPNDKSGGVGLVIADFVSKYVQRIHRQDSRFIAIDLFLPAKKLKIINVYGFQRTDFGTKGKSFNQYVIDHITQAEKDNFKVIIMGDLNADPTIYLKSLAAGRTPVKHFSLVEFLYNSNYIDQHPKNDIGLEYATLYVNSTPTSRIDSIWYPDDFIESEFLFDQVWQPPFSQLSTHVNHQLDHRSIIIYFTKDLFIGNLPAHRIKQKGEWRTFYDVKNATQEQWTSYKNLVSSNLSDKDNNHNSPDNSPMPFNKILLNNKWHILKSAIHDAAKNSLPIKKISPAAVKKQKEDEALIKVKNNLRDLNIIFAFLTEVLYKSSGNYQQQALQAKWKGKQQCLKQTLSDIIKIYPTTISPIHIPDTIKQSNTKSFYNLRIKVAALRNTVKAHRDCLEKVHRDQRIKEFESIRCSNYADNKSAFIASSLNKSKRSIILDKAMDIRQDGSEVLLTEPSLVKSKAIDHFQTFAGIPPKGNYNRDEFKPRWKNSYSPLSSVNSSIYNGLMDQVTDDEFNTALNSLPSGKAAGLSGIPYEMLKHLPTNAKAHLKDLVSLCFETSHIPSAWKDATVYPIPKPHEWHSYLNNTRPITLLDTARKLTTRIMYNRLAPILAEHKVLKGNNYAGLPGCSCDPPIFTFETILNDAKTNNKPLFVFQQDISKAFDSIDVNMLRLAMQRLKIPNTFINLTLDLFTNRSNTIITAFGHTQPYKVQVGIDQGEVISPLLWVIYIDPLLTVLNQENPSPYTIQTNPSLPPVSTSTLGYMDDTNLIACTSQGILTMLQIAQEFYSLNNTKINFNKAIFICNRDPLNNSLPIPTTPVPFNFLTSNTNFSITPLSPNESFRFLGVWFTLSLSASYVKKQCATEYRLFAAKLKHKRLTHDQLRYLHNAVLLPRVEFRLKATTLSEKECLNIMGPFKRIFKNSLHLNISTPNAFLQYNQALGLTNLHQRLITNHATVIHKIIKADDSFPSKLLFLHRMYSLQQSLHIPYSPLFINNFSPFSRMQIFKTDFILKLLSFTSELGIHFMNPNNIPPIKLHHTPLYLLFKDNPILYNQSVKAFKKYKIAYVSDFISNDGIIFLPLSEIIHRNSDYRIPPHIPKWYTFITSNITVSPNSIRIKDEYKAAQLQLNRPPTSLLDSRNLLPTVDIPKTKRRVSYWCAMWDNIIDKPIYGRVVKNSPQDDIVIQHWIKNISPAPSSSSKSFTPKSKPLVLKECPGCPLHDHDTHQRNGHNHRIDRYLLQYPCLSFSSHERTLNLRHLQQSRYTREDDSVESHTLRTTEFQLIPQIKASLSATSPTSGHQLSTPIPNNNINPQELDLYFTHNSNSIKVTTPNTRHCLKSLFSAFNFSSLLNLDRWKDILTLHQHQSIDWTASWHAYNCHNGESKVSTTYKHSARVVFSTKLMLDELPLLSHLQSYRRPDLYKADWMCILCHNERETWSHLWTCSALRPFITTLIENTKQVFEHHLAKSTKLPSTPPTPTWHNLPCWQLPSNNKPVSNITFEFLIRGFIPKQLTHHLSFYFNKKDRLNIIGEVINNAVDSFREKIWKLRCEEFARFEQMVGITPAAKKEKRRLSDPNTTIVQDSRHHHTSTSPHPPTSYKTWVYQALEAGSVDKWMDFHTRINSLSMTSATD